MVKQRLSELIFLALVAALQTLDISVSAGINVEGGHVMAAGVMAAGVVVVTLIEKIITPADL